MIYFISDIHLGAKYIADPREHERRVVEFFNSIRHDADELYLLGDILDYWFEYRNVVPRGFIRFFGALAALSDAGVKITWLTGNHDIWLFDYFSKELGIEIIDAPTIERQIKGKKFLLCHGDRIGRQKLSFRFICSLFRNKFCQKLYSGIHPRWTIPFAHAWSSHSRSTGDSMSLSQFEEYIVHNAESIETSADYIVMGHYHIMLERQLSGRKSSLFVLGDWISNFSFGCFDGTRFTLKKFTK